MWLTKHGKQGIFFHWFLLMIFHLLFSNYHSVFPSTEDDSICHWGNALSVAFLLFLSLSYLHTGAQTQSAGIYSPVVEHSGVWFCNAHPFMVFNEKFLSMWLSLLCRIGKKSYVSDPFNCFSIPLEFTRLIAIHLIHLFGRSVGFHSEHWEIPLLAMPTTVVRYFMFVFIAVTTYLGCKHCWFWLLVFVPFRQLLLHPLDYKVGLLRYHYSGYYLNSLAFVHLTLGECWSFLVWNSNLLAFCIIGFLIIDVALSWYFLSKVSFMRFVLWFCMELMDKYSALKWN